MNAVLFSTNPLVLGNNIPIADPQADRDAHDSPTNALANAESDTAAYYKAYAQTETRNEKGSGSVRIARLSPGAAISGADAGPSRYDVWGNEGTAGGTKMAVVLTWDDSATEQYLICEEKAQTKSEFVNGRVRQMAGASQNHNDVEDNARLVIGRAVRQLPRTLLGRPCRSYGSDMRVLAEATGDYVYPDVTIVCGKRQIMRRRGDHLTNPTVVFEISSDSTVEYDRTTKFDIYKSIPSLREYVLLGQDAVLCEHFVRQDDDSWSQTVYSSPEAVITLSSAGIAFPLGDVYEDVDFDAGILEDAADVD